MQKLIIPRPRWSRNTGGRQNVKLSNSRAASNTDYYERGIMFSSIVLLIYLFNFTFVWKIYCLWCTRHLPQRGEAHIKQHKGFREGLS